MKQKKKGVAPKKKAVVKKVVKSKPQPKNVAEQPKPIEKPAEKSGSEKFLDKAKLQNDNVFIDVKIESLAKLTGLKVVKGFSNAVVAEGEIVNIVSPEYGLVKNEEYFVQVEQQLI